jgi:hypothetical protein
MLLVGGAGAFLVVRAWTLAPPAAPEFREASGRVVGLPSEPCGPRSRPWTCHRPIVEYVVLGQTLRTTARKGYRPAPFRLGDSVPVLLGHDGSVWLQPEWDSQHASERSEVKREKTMGFVLGALTLAVALLGMVFVAAVLAAKGPSDGEGPDESGPSDG